ncbi:hypothetical protein KAJ27_24895 [bacterium]|nr:hypothetical protein [bacterium]
MKKNNEEIKDKFEIKIIDLFWFEEGKPEEDLCVHGQLKVQIGNEVMVDKSEDESWTLSSTALSMLRTLERDHIPGKTVQMVPCCGFNFIYEGDMEEVLILGCPNGIDWEVIHIDNEIKLKTEKGTEARIDFETYKSKVLSFVDQIEKFYVNADEKIVILEEWEAGYAKFREEWKERRNKWKT